MEQRHDDGDHARRLSKIGGNLNRCNANGVAGSHNLRNDLGRPINVQNSRTRDALAMITPAATDSVFADPFENVSALRRLASHKVRTPAKPMRAFEQFTADLQSCHSALRHLRTASKRS